MGTQRKSLSGLELTLLVVFLCAVPSSGWAQVATSITSSGLNTAVSSPATLPNGQVIHNITGGTRPGNGANLFHSFGDFSVGTGHIANFLNNTGLPTSNILGRVTGGNPSNIFGTLQTTGFGNANLFLMNPAGVIFGPTASLNVGGMVYVSTSNYIKLADGARFNAVSGAGDALLSAAPVAAFGFLGNNPAAIAVRGSTLTVAEGQSISLVGGNTGFIDGTGTAVPGGVSVTNGSLVAPGGQVNIVSVGKPSNSSVGGEVPLDSTHAPTGFKTMGDVSIVRNSAGLAEISTSGEGGKIVIRGGHIMIQDYRIVADAGPGGVPGGIEIEGRDISIANKNNPPCPGCGIDTIRIGGNYGGSVTITGSASITVDKVILGGAIDPFAVFPTGPVTLSAPTLSVTGTSFRIGGSLLTRGSLRLLGDNITLIGSSIYKGENFTPADVLIQAQKSVDINGFNMQQLIAAGDQPGSSVSIQGRDVHIVDVGINTSHFGMDGLGDAGQITITGQRNVSVANSEFTANAGGVPRAGTPGVSDAGNITLTAGKDLGVSNTTMTANTSWAGQGGNIVLGARGNLTVDQSTLSVNSTQTQPNFFGIGPAGNIAIGAGKNVSVTNSTFSANSQGPVEAGVIGIGAGKNLSINHSTVSADALGGGGEGKIILGAGKNVSVQSSTLTPAPSIFIAD